MKKFRLKAFIFLAAFAMLAGEAVAAVSITSEVDPQKATIGDTVFYIITLKNDSGETPKPQVKLLNPEPFELINVELIEGKPEPSISKIVFTLAVFDTGKLKLPEYIYEWRDENGEIKSLKTDELFIEIESVITSEEPDANAIEREALPKRDWLAYATPILLLLLLIVAATAIYLYLKKQKTKQTAIEAIPETPYEAVLRKLKEIKSGNLYREGKIKEYFSHLSDALRQYIEDTYRVEAMEWTTSELSRAFPYKIEKQRDAVIQILETCDAVKFAKATPSETEAADTLNSAISFTKKTEYQEDATTIAQ